MPTNIKESGLEAIIVNYLIKNNGYELGTNEDYNRDYAVDESRLLRFLQDTQPDEVEKIGILNSDHKKAQFLNRLQGEIARRGIIDVLRKGINFYPANLIMFYMTPTEKNIKAREMFEKNIFSVTRQLMYSKNNTQLALDLVIFINGLPIITAELKNRLTKQNVDDAVQQYKLDRDPRELLFQFKRCMVHFPSTTTRSSSAPGLKARSPGFCLSTRATTEAPAIPLIPMGSRQITCGKIYFQKPSLPI